jgi:hypothetical protein
MTKKKFLNGLIVILVFALLVINFQLATASSYRFQVDTYTVNVYVNTDGTETIEYFFHFINDSGASPIDYIDVGVPNSNFDLSNISADVDGNTITDISNSQYVKPGVALGLGSNQIPENGSGMVHATIRNVSRVLYPGTQKESEAYASLDFSPTWFSSDYAYGATNLTASLFLPPAMQSTEPRYFQPTNWPGAADPQTGYDSNNRIFYRWQSNDANAYTQYTFGASFPARYIPAAAIVKQVTLPFNTDDLCCGGVALLFLLIFGFIIYTATIGAQKRKLQYLPPKISIEGHGIKRGLTAVEAGILMEHPMDKILTMILFSTIKKNAAKVTQKEPLTLELTNPLPAELLPYEVDFLNAFQEQKLPDRRNKLQDMMINLVKSVTEKMKGFSRKETLAYYEEIERRAWEQVEAADTPDVKMQKYDEVMDWAMLDHKYEDRTRQSFGPNPVFVPMWWPRYDPGYHVPSITGSASASIPGGHSTTITMPSIPGADFAASVVTSTQAFSSHVIGDLTSFTSGITNKTNPAPVGTSSGSFGGGGGGHSCACACACAGCACACAGGGR